MPEFPLTLNFLTAILMQKIIMDYHPAVYREYR